MKAFLASLIVGFVLHICAGQTNDCSPLVGSALTITCSRKGSKVSCSERLPVGTVAKVQCRKGYLPKPDVSYNQMTCKKSGKWNKKLFKCIRAPTVEGYKFFRRIGFYKFYSNAMTWDEAKTQCEGDTGHLVIINSAEEMDIVDTLINEHPSLESATNNDEIHVGADDKVTEGTFIDVKGKPWKDSGFANFCNPPDNYGEEDCVAIIRGKRCFNDIRCISKRGFICEVELSK